jgi:hypothetical protein
MRVTATAAASPVGSHLRSSFGLSASEEAIAQLLSCSVPPRVVCWLSSDRVLFDFSDAAFGRTTVLENVHPVAPASVMANPLERVIDDVVGGEGGEFYVLHRGGEAGAARELSIYTSRGRKTGGLSLAEPLRVLVAVLPSRLLAVGASGRLVSVPR